MEDSRVPNERLRGHRKLRGWSQQDLVNELLAMGDRVGERNLGLTFKQVSRWEQGWAKPGPPYTKLLCLVFRTSARELGLYDPPEPQPPMVAGGLPPDHDSDRALRFEVALADGIMVATDFWRADVDRREFLVEATFAAGALIPPAWLWLFGPSDAYVTTAGGPQVGRADVERIRSDTELFMQMDERQGGGHARWLVVSYLDHQVAPLLQGTYTDEVGRELFEAAAFLTREVGTMASDAGRNGLAQRYLVQALRLAHAAGDRALGADVLTSMAHVATYLGHPDEAVQLTRAARQGAEGSTTSAQLARIFAAEARACARLGDKSDCEKALSLSSRAFERGDRTSGPCWLGSHREADLARRFSECFLSLRQPRRAEEYAGMALGGFDERYARRRAMVTALLASSHLGQKEVERACATGLEAVALAGAVTSRWSLDAIRDLQTRFTPYERLKAVKEFNDQATALLQSAR